MSLTDQEATDVAVDTAAPETSDVPRESSPAETGVAKSMLEAVTGALEKDAEEAPTSEGGKEKSEPDSGETASAAKEGEADEADLTDDEVRQLSQRAQHRFRSLVAGLKERDGKIAEIEPKARQLDEITGYLRTHDISPEEFDNTLGITRLIKAGDYPKAFAILDPIYQELAKRSGRVLPDDLRERVRLGYLTEADAKELHASRTAAGLADQRERTQAERAAEAERARETQAFVNTLTEAGDTWTRQKSTSDPDWKQKEPLVVELVELEMRRRATAGTLPRTREDAVKLMDDALRTVEARFKTVAPKPQQRSPVTGRFASPRSEKQPSSMLEAMQLAVNRSG